jgi:hypothetical protein
MSTPALFARSSLGPRGLDGGSIAGAVVGSVVGALLLLCAVPFILRACRGRCGDAAVDPELAQGQSPGGRSSIDESKRLPGGLDVPAYSPASPPGPVNGQHPKSPNGHSPHPPSLIPAADGAHLHQGLPPPSSSPFAPASGPDQHPLSSKAQDYGQAYPTPPADEPIPPRTHHVSAGTLGRSRESTRQLSLTDSYNTPSRELTDITTHGITEEPETFDHRSTSPSHRHFPHLFGSLRKLTGRRGSERQDSKKSTTDTARSPSITTTEVLYQQERIEPVFNDVDINARGEAWSYYHDPNLVSESSDAFAPEPSASAPLTVVLPAQAAAQTLPSPTSVLGGPTPQPMIARAVVEEPDSFSPDTYQTTTPLRAFSRQTSLLKGNELLRKDSLPPLQPIVADIGSPPIPALPSPSARPEDMMRPTNEAETLWRVNQEHMKIESPPPPVDLIYTPYMEPIGEASYMGSNPSPESDYHSPPGNYHSPPGMMPEPDYHTTPGIILNDQDFTGVDFNQVMPYVNTLEDQMVQHSYFTPPPSSGPSNQNTPDTRVSDYTGSPSPLPDVGHESTGQMDSSPRLFPCDKCARVFDQVHKLNHHKRYHDRPHECPYTGCIMRFGTKTHLDRHINDKHLKTRKYHCTQPQCPFSRQGGKSFPRKDNWRRHMINKHHITPDSDPVEFNDDMMMVT